LKKDQVHLFKQGCFPALSFDGKILLASKSKISMAPNGNGGLWRALHDQGILADLKKKGVTWIASYSVDNILVKIADPLFIGWCIDSDLEVGAKVVPKASPEERVGVLAYRDGKPCVIEYSEIPEATRTARNPNGDLKFNASNLVIYNLRVDFVAQEATKSLPWHLAKKAIPVVDESGRTKTPSAPNGFKLELFSFDIFDFVSSPEKMKALEVIRSEEFSPLKNSEKEATDNPKTCREHLSVLHAKWITSAGGKFLNSGLCEISPLLSYEGEALGELVSGKEFSLPLHLQ